MTFDRLREFEPVGIAAVGPEPSAMISANANSGWIKRLIPLLSTRRTAFIVALIAALVAMVSATLIPRVIMLAIDNAVVDDSSSLAPYLVALGGLAIVRAFLTKHYRSTLFRVAYDLEYDLRVTMHAHFLRLGLAYFDRVQAGQLISRANSDIRSVQMYLTFAPLLFLSIASFAVGIGLMLSIHVALTLASLITLPFTFLAGRRLRNLTFPLSWIVQGRAADLASIVDENIQGVRVVRSFAAEQRELESLARAAQKLRWAQIVAADARARWGPVIENLPRLGLVVVLLYGGQLAIDGVVTVGGLIAFNAYVLLIQAPFRMLPFVLILGQRAAASAGRIFEVLDEPPTIVDAAGAVDLQAPNGVVEFNHVTFSYADRDAHILDDFSLSIPEGQIVAIVGRTGSGKSTIARILARFYDIDSGTITIDAQNIEACTLVSVRHAVAVVSDEPFLFSDSIHKTSRSPDQTPHAPM